ncbi:MAG: Gfo/Idh/MocA family oxidoreductase [Dysgonamonadaceae bacterium]|jgi:predicted dehydrogenase|nr:Gfo/Idh/MocA family oxidoreductase [Dysgonamonadaceae bacterium]
MITRRTFLKTGGLAATGLALGGVGIANSLSSQRQSQQPVYQGRKIKLACIGIGNRGEQIMEDFERTGLADIVALCDVDMGNKQTLKMMSRYPNARQFKDFRELFDKFGNEFEAVSIAIPDFAHFPAAMCAIAHGKHVYVEKPMARTFLEAELMMAAAKKNPNIVTQVGNQGHSDANYFQFKAWLDAGIIKDITKVTCHMNNDRRWHSWDPNIKKLPEGQPVPPTLDWDVWHTTRFWHDYNEKYHQGEWRSWYDFGMGALGDWGAHIMDTVHEFLELGLPYEVNPVKLTGHNDYFYPMSSTILFRFPARKKFPALDLTWYDGVDNLPPLPEGYGKSELAADIPASGVGEIKEIKVNPGKIIYGKDLIFKGGSHGSTLQIIPEEKAKAMESKLPEVPKSPSNHFANFLLACQGKEKTRSPFEIHGALSQVFSLGVIAQRTNSLIQFDAKTKQITNNPFANALLTQEPPRKGWEEYYSL